MDKLNIRKIQAEIENVETVIAVLNKYKVIKKYSELELAGIATYIHNFYNGTENILKQLLLNKTIKIEDTPSWHRELLLKAFENQIVSEKLHDNLLKFLSFRHFFIHSYSFILDEKELKSLLAIIFETWKEFKAQIKM